MVASKKKRKSAQPSEKDSLEHPKTDVSLEFPTFHSARKYVEIIFSGNSTTQLDIESCLPVATMESFELSNPPQKEEELEKLSEEPTTVIKMPISRTKGSKNKSSSKLKHKKSITGSCDVKEPSEEKHVPVLPESVFKVIDYSLKPTHEMPTNYIRFIETSPEALEEEVEYDMDEEDCAWLQLMNERRNTENMPLVTMEDFELLMDRLEKESYFQMHVSGKDHAPPIDEEAVCCICMDGDCQNTNVILFCDMCNLAVHQECYGVPYIPEGQWLCRRCLQSPSRAVDCVLCPNKGGAFKQTAEGRWAHVVCALWIPEVIFANTVFLEPIDNIQNIPQARWRLTCYICKQKSVGSCIQCNKSNCYTAFHVTCAQQAGLHMKMEAVRESTSGGMTFNVKKSAFCDFHTPADSDSKPQLKDLDLAELNSKSSLKLQSQLKMKKARKILAEKRCSPPVVSIPTLPTDKLQQIASSVSGIHKRNQFIQRLIAYWTLKRQSRNGVPLLRRLQASHSSRRDIDKGTFKQVEALFEQLKYWQRLRQDLERARLLCELIRKREKLKKELIKLKEEEVMLQICSMKHVFLQIVSYIKARDTHEVFWEPVSQSEVPDYHEVIKHPMDLYTMRTKIEQSCYPDVESLEKDFDLMISNCLTYNDKDTIFYRIGNKIKETGKSIFEQARKHLRESGYDVGPDPQTPSPSKGAKKISTVETSISGDRTRSRRSKKPAPEPEEKSQDTIDPPPPKSRKLSPTKPQVSIESQENESKKILRTRRGTPSISNDPASKNSSAGPSHVKPPQVTSTKLQTKEAKPEGAPIRTGVNRRTAVLFTKKAQAVLKPNAASRRLSTRSRRSDDKQVTTSPAVPTSDKSETPSGNSLKRKRTPSSSKGEIEPIKDKSVSPKIDGLNFKNTLSNTSPVDTMATHSESFQIYRQGGEILPLSDEEDNAVSDSDSLSSAQMSSTSGDSFSYYSDDDRSDSSAGSHPRLRNNDISLEPLDLVWAKCRGYPWYPALIIDPKMPRTGYFHNGVPIPVPPEDVLALVQNYDHPVYLVLFFDAKRTWQWLPRVKLEPLGLDSALDNSKLSLSKKPTEKKAVKKAYEKAILHRCRVSGNNASLSGEMSNGEDE